MHLSFSILFPLYCCRLAKRSRALLASNPTRDNQTRAGESPAGPGDLHRQGLFFPHFSSFICPVMPQKTHVSTANQPRFHPRILLKNPNLVAVRGIGKREALMKLAELTVKKKGRGRKR